VNAGIIPKDVDTMPINNNDNIHDNNNTISANNIENNYNSHNTNENNNFIPENNSKNNYDSNHEPLISNDEIDINAIVSDASVLPDDDKKKISSVFDLFLNNNVICYKCVENTSAKDKIVFVYDVSKKNNGDGYDLKSVPLKFGYCERHKSEVEFSFCNKNTQNLLWCGHRLCNKCLEKRTGVKNAFPVCDNCKAVCCKTHYVDHFDTHILCNAKNNRHYVCFNDSDEGNPVRKNPRYNAKVWVCPKHLGK
jgi:hypothetical protein